MTKSKHFFQFNELYYLKDVLDYIKKKNPSLDIPGCWSTGGSLNEKVRCEYGILPTWTNGIEGRGHREKYSGSQMYSISTYLIQDLKEGNIQRRTSRSLTPIEALATGDKIPAEDFVEAFGGPSETKPVTLTHYKMSDREKLEEELQRMSDELTKQFKAFMEKIVEAYMAST